MTHSADRRQRDRPREPGTAPPPEPERLPANHALAAALQRKVGWENARTKANTEQRRTEAADGRHAVERIPIDGIKGKGLPSKAIVVMPSLLQGAKSIDVLLHLHGYTPGYATGDDQGVYNIEAQMAAAGRELIAILPQGSGDSDFNAGAGGKSFDSDTFIAAVFARLGEEGRWGAEDAPRPGRVILSSHSGGDQSIWEMLKSGQGAAGKAPAKLDGMFLFDTMITSAFGGAVGDFVDARIRSELDHLRLMKFSPQDPAEIEAAMLAWIKENGFRLQVVYRKGGAYDAAARDIDSRLKLRFASSIKELGPSGSPVHAAMRANFVVHEITDLKRIGHMDVLAGDDALRTAIEMLPTGDAVEGVPREREHRPMDAIDTPQLMRLASYAGNHALARRLARDAAPPVTAPEKVKMTVRWDTTEPPKPYLKDTFDDHPVDWSADVYIDGKKVGSGKGSLDVELVKDSEHTIKVVPTPAGANNDFYRTTSTKKPVKAKAGTFDLNLSYNRENRWFTDESWEKVGIDPAKATKVKSKIDLLGFEVTVNELVIPTVTATNTHFNSSALTPEDRTAVKSQLLHIGGYNRRTTSSGAFSNHSTGCAVDIDANMETSQNFHFKKDEKSGKKRMELFAHVVKRESGWSAFDGWSEKDSKKWLEASRLFNFHFPMFLSELLDDAAGGGTGYKEMAEFGEGFDWIGGTAAVGTAMVTSLDAAKLRKAAAVAKKAKKTTTAAWLERTAADWTAVRAWIEGVVMYDDEKWAFISDHEKRAAAGTEKRKPVGELHGPITLHPKLVETMEKGGWTWLIDQTDAKDFMHFEDRKAFDAIKK